MLLFFGIGKLVYVSVLILNAIAVLSEDRFLARIGWGRTQQSDPVGFGSSHDPNGFKARGVELINSIRTFFRIPLIAVNTFIILYELALG